MGLKCYSLVPNGVRCWAEAGRFIWSTIQLSIAIHQMCTIYISVTSNAFCAFILFHLLAISLVFCLSLLQTVSILSFLFLCRLLLCHPREFPWEGYVIAPPTSKGSRGRKAADWGNLALGRERPLILIPNRHTSKWSRGRGGRWGGGLGCKTWQVGTDLSLFIQRC